MTITRSVYRCSLPSGHDDWVPRLLGYLAADPDPDVRESLLSALEYVAREMALPGYALEVKDYLANEILQRNTPLF